MEMAEKKVFLFRLIRPANPLRRVNIYSQFTSRTTTFGLVMAATMINKLWNWRVEIIDEENYRGPRDKNGLPDHAALQQENPADVVGFYCGLTSTIERAWDLAGFYKSQGAITLAGSWHAHYCPEETLRRNIDLVVHGDAELAIRKIIENIEQGLPLWHEAKGVSYISDDKVIHICPDGETLTDIFDFDERLVSLENRLSSEELNNLPYPDFGLIKYARIKIYPIGRIRGCSMRCKFCSVKGGVRFGSPEHLFGMVDWLVKTRRAKSFFIVDDRSEEDIAGTLQFFEMIAEKYGSRLSFTVQMRLLAVKNIMLIDIMKKAGVEAVCLGLESPIEEELKAMRKGITARKMVELVRAWRRYFKVHGMFIFGYPVDDQEDAIPIGQKIKRFKRFIKKTHLDFVQVLLPVPFPGTELFAELKAEGRLFPLSAAPWNKYDGNFILFKPSGNVKLEDIQAANIKIMAWFYSPFSLYKLIYRTLAFPIDYLVRGWRPWHADWGREVIKSIGHKIVTRWKATRESEIHIETLEKHQ
ncbi:MAG: radical SAM protein [Parcubacteria group bacterium Licking1014_1]|nr:MAG: radical SAM protein [Parcubacteria group bacterium Licking1014_1]